MFTSKHLYRLVWKKLSQLHTCHSRIILVLSNLYMYPKHRTSIKVINQKSQPNSKVMKGLLLR